jgi:hypothetical protein
MEGLGFAPHVDPIGAELLLPELRERDCLKLTPLAFDYCARCDVVRGGVQQNACNSKASSFNERSAKSRMAVAAATVAWRYVVSDVAAVGGQERRVYVVAQASDAHHFAAGRDEPAVRARNPTLTKVDAALLIREALDVCRKVHLRWSVELGVRRISFLEVDEHFEKRALVFDGRPNDADCQERDLTFDMSGGRKQAKPAGGCPLDGVVRRHAPSASRFSASFIAINPCLVAPFNDLRNSGTSRPVNLSPWRNRTPAFEVVSSLK